MVPLEYRINFWKTLELTLMNCETLTWSANYVISSSTATNQNLCSDCNFNPNREGGAGGGGNPPLTSPLVPLLVFR